MSKKIKVFHHVDQWFEAINNLNGEISITGVYFKHGMKLHVQRMVGQVFMEYTSTILGEEFSSKASHDAVWDSDGLCRVNKKRCPVFDLQFPTTVE